MNEKKKNQKPLDTEQIFAALDEVLPDIARVDRAKTFNELTGHLKTDKEVQDVMRREYQMIYKGSDKYGRVFIMKNPAIMQYQAYLKRSPIVRRVPQIYHVEDDSVGVGHRLGWRTKQEWPETENLHSWQDQGNF